MASSGQQVKNGKAFEYSIAKEYFNYLSGLGLNVSLDEHRAYSIAKSYYESFDDSERKRFDTAAHNTIPTLVKLEPGLQINGFPTDIIQISINEDSAGEKGDVRDVIISHTNPKWEIGFSAKNNNDAIKHSRLSMDIDFGNIWLGYPCSSVYWNDIKPIFNYLNEKIKNKYTWSQLGKEKESVVYLPLLKAFRDEVLRISSEYEDVPQKLIEYLIGNKPFYKIIKDDSHNLVVVKAYNMHGGLNRPYVGTKSQYALPKIFFPTRIVEFDFKKNSQTTLNMILDRGWEISFRIHNASTMVERSLKFDIQLLGNPPILFTQHLFQ